MIFLHFSQAVPSWSKDTTFMLMWVATTFNLVHRYAEEMIPVIMDSYTGVASGQRQTPSVRVREYHHRTGEFASIEARKRTTFGLWVLDEGLCRGILKYLILPTRCELKNLTIFVKLFIQP